jgi:spore maturation protein B
MNLDAILSIAQTIANWAVPILLVGIPLYAVIRGVKVYELFCEGAREGFDVAVRIMPFLVAILIAIGMFRDSLAMDSFAVLVGPMTGLIGMPPEILPLALIRPLSGGGALGIMNSILIEYGPDSLQGQMASILQGSTETTFYVLAVYFGSVNIRKTRHALYAGLAGDLAGVLAAVTLANIAFGSVAP